MLSDMDVITHRFGGEIIIYPVADVHLGALEHAEKEWEHFLKYVQTTGAYLILDGDLLNNSVRSCRFTNPFDEVLRPREAKKRMVEYLEPIKDRILCITSGNHEARTARDSDQSLGYDIASRLDVEHLYRENIAFIRIQLGRRAGGSGKAEVCYTFVVTHGASNGILTGGGINSGERFGNVLEGVDCLVTGHVHRGAVTNPGKICFDARNGVVVMKSYTYVSCVSWLKYGGYAARRMYTPAEVAKPQQLRLICDHHHKDIEVLWRRFDNADQSNTHN